MIDIKAGSVQGIGRCRLLWQQYDGRPGGQLRAYTLRDGVPRLAQVWASKHSPERIKRWRGGWVVRDVEVGKRSIHIRPECWTCGGWWRMLKIRARDLWRLGND